MFFADEAPSGAPAWDLEGDDALVFHDPPAPTAARPPLQPTPEPPPPPPAPAATQPVMAMPQAPPPILMDVTPHSLGIETAGGYVRRLIAKNAPVPTEQSRSFTTARDDQREVAVRICQGEAEAFDANEVLGEVVLDDLPARTRGATSIDVTFMLDADGTLAVEARDRESGRTQKTRITLRGGHSDEDIRAMRERLESEERRA